ncbi:tetratricopeptide repeat protein, partial [bacterium]|nr:tetratricopeptide repeat protein [bacterium]
MSKTVCPFLVLQKNADHAGSSCIFEKCTFFTPGSSACLFQELGNASREYLASIKKMAEQNELILLRDRIALLSEDEKKERVQLYISQAKISMNKGNFDQALLDFQKALILNPHDTLVHRSMGDIFSMRGVHDEAISEFKSVLKHDTEDGETWIKLILQYRAMFQDLPHKEQLYSEVAQKLREELRSVESQSIANCTMGQCLLILHSAQEDIFKTQREEARTLMERAIEMNPENLWAHLGIRDILFYDKSYESAVEQLNIALDHIQNHPRLLFESGETYLISQGENTSYRKALELDPTYSPPYFRLGFINEQKASYDQAIEFYQQGLGLNPTHVFARFRLGKIYSLNGMLDLAIERFREVVSLSSNLRQESYQEGYIFNKLRFFKEANALGALIELGKIFTHRRQFPEAMEAYQKALEIDKNSSLAIINLVDLHCIQNQEKEDREGIFDRLIEQFRGNAVVDSQSPIAHFALAYACQTFPSAIPEKQEERQEQALNGYQMTINLNPDFKWAYWGLKNSYLKPMAEMSPLFDEALEACQRVVEMDPQDPRAYFELAEVYRKMGRNDEAIQNFQSAIQNDLSYIPAYFGISEIRYDAKEFDEAIKFCQRVIRINPKFARGYFELGRVYKEKGQSEKALSNLKKAVELDLNYLDAYQMSGEILFAEENYENAFVRFKKVLELDPKNVSAHYRIARIYDKGKKFAEALSEYNTAVSLSPDPIEIQFSLARLFAGHQKWPEAQATLEEILKRDPKHTSAILEYAGVLEKQQQPEKAE